MVHLFVNWFDQWDQHKFWFYSSKVAIIELIERTSFESLFCLLWSHQQLSCEAEMLLLKKISGLSNFSKVAPPIASNWWHYIVPCHLTKPVKVTEVNLDVNFFLTSLIGKRKHVSGRFPIRPPFLFFLHFPVFQLFWIHTFFNLL